MNKIIDLISAILALTALLMSFSWNKVSGVPLVLITISFMFWGYTVQSLKTKEFLKDLAFYVGCVGTIISHCFHLTGVASWIAVAITILANLTFIIMFFKNKKEINDNI